jgi:hypothetical protein
VLQAWLESVGCGQIQVGAKGAVLQ